MRILHISRTMGQGGAEKIVFQLCRDNDLQTQFVISDGGSYVEELRKIGVKHFYMPDINSKNPFKMIQCFFKILYVVKIYKIQVIHSHHRMAAFYARIVSFFTETHCVYTAHNVFFDKRKLLRFALKHTKVVAVGDDVKKNLINFYGLSPNRVNVIYNSIDAKVTNIKNPILKREKKSGKYLIGTIGRITKQKGFDIFIKAIEKFSKKKSNIIGVIVGNGEDLQKMQQLTVKLMISDKIIFLGYQNNILDIVKQLDLIVLPSRWEGLPLTPIEVFSQKKTIVATDIPGTNEIVKDHYNGLLFPKDSVADLVNSLQILSDDKGLEKKLEVNAYRTFQSKYRYDHFINRYNSVYRSLE